MTLYSCILLLLLLLLSFMLMFFYDTPATGSPVSNSPATQQPSTQARTTAVSDDRHQRQGFQGSLEGSQLNREHDCLAFIQIYSFLSTASCLFLEPNTYAFMIRVN